MHFGKVNFGKKGEDPLLWLRDMTPQGLCGHALFVEECIVFTFFGEKSCQPKAAKYLIMPYCTCLT